MAFTADYDLIPTFPFIYQSATLIPGGIYAQPVRLRTECCFDANYK